MHICLLESETRGRRVSKKKDTARLGVLLKVKRAAAAMASVAAVGGSIAVAALAEALAQAAERRKRGPLILRPGGRPIDPARARGQRLRWGRAAAAMAASIGVLGGSIGSSRAAALACGGLERQPRWKRCRFQLRTYCWETLMSDIVCIWMLMYNVM